MVPRMTKRSILIGFLLACIRQQSVISPFMYPRTVACRSARVAATSASRRRVREEDAMAALDRLEAMDGKLGLGMGASKERAKLNAIIEQWEADCEAAASNDDDDDDDDDVDEGFWDSSKFVPKHSPEERIAIFGGNPARRRQAVEKKLSPYQTLDQFGTPRDVGPSDASRLLKKISSGQYDAVYLWTRFNCHSSRSSIREACVETGTRFFEVESLAYIR